MAEKLSYQTGKDYKFGNAVKSSNPQSVFGNPKLAAAQKANDETEVQEVEEQEKPITINDKNQERINKIEAKTNACFDKLENTNGVVEKLKKSKITQMHPFAFLFKDMITKFGEMLSKVVGALMQSQQVQMTDDALERKLAQVASDANSTVAKIVNLSVKSQKISKLDDKLLEYKNNGGNVEDIKLEEVYEKLNQNLNNAEFEGSDGKVSDDEKSDNDADDDFDKMEEQFSEDEFSKKLDKAMEFLDGKDVDSEDADFVEEKALAQRKQEQENGSKTSFDSNKFMYLRDNSNLRKRS